VTTGSSINPERVFVEVVIQMLMTDSSLMRAHHPSLEQGGYPVTMRQKVFAYLRSLACHFMSIPHGIQSAIAFPSVGTNYTAGTAACWTASSKLSAERRFNKAADFWLGGLARKKLRRGAVKI